MADQKINVKALTWNRESSGLFDYENKNYSKTGFRIAENSYVLQTSDKVSHASVNSDLMAFESTRILAMIVRTQRSFMLGTASVLIDQGIVIEKPWLVVKSLKTSEYLLSAGDVIRFGKVKLRIKEISIPQRTQVFKPILHSKCLQNGGLANLNKKYTEKESPIDMDIVKELRENLACRICLVEDNDKSDPLIKPCYCAGTMGLVHVKCLQRWLEGKIIKTCINKIAVYRWKSLQCELCKYLYPSKISVHGEIIDLVKIETPSANYIVFEALSEGLQTRSVLPFDGKASIKIGRGYDSDLRLADISVSRNHAVIIVRNSCLYLQDNHSKFGTLIKVQKEVYLDPDSKFHIQCGRTLLKLTVQKPWSFFGCFSGCSKGRDSEEELNRNSRNLTQDISTRI